MMNKSLCLRLSWSLLGLFVLASCENISLVDADEEKEDAKGSGLSVQTVVPESFGEGTQESPFTVDQFLDEAEELRGETVWLVGYAVGETYRSLSNACFTPPFEYTSNVLLSADVHCTHVGKCVPVELTTSAQKTTLALSNHPEHHQQCVMMQGKVMTFFGTSGLRQLKAYYWLPDDFQVPLTEPTEWDEVEWE